MCFYSISTHTFIFCNENSRLPNNLLFTNIISGYFGIINLLYKIIKKIKLMQIYLSKISLDEYEININADSKYNI